MMTHMMDNPVAAMMVLIGLVVLTELSYASAFAQTGGLARLLAPLQGAGWVIGAALLIGGGTLFSRYRRRLRAAWDQAMTDHGSTLAMESGRPSAELVFSSKENT